MEQKKGGEGCNTYDTTPIPSACHDHTMPPSSAARRRKLAVRAIVLAAACSVVPHSADCASISLSDGTYPYLYSLEPRTPLKWHQGAIGFMMASSEAVRINSRGIRFISGSFSVMTISSKEEEGGGAWTYSPCRVSKRSMCEIFDTPNDAYRSSIFPNAGSPVLVNIQSSDAVEEFGFFRDLESNRCPEAATGRSYSMVDNHAASDQQAVPVQRTIDVSLCNVVGVGGDFVFLPHRRQLYAIYRPISFQIFAAMSILTVLMVITLSKNLEISMGSSQTSKDASNPIFTVLCMASLLLLSMFATGSLDVLAPFVTMEASAQKQ